ncbi:hypothetical protein OAR83_00390 [Alphaproteobacteria bacterium]|nr:hypothetical protein [Alphaproteobacteria bacterium]
MSKILVNFTKRRAGMSRQTKPVFTIESETVFGKQTGVEAKDLGIEFVHFDRDDKPASQHIVPLGNFISDQPLTSEEYLITRSLVAAQASK